MKPYNTRESLTKSVFSFLHVDSPMIEYEWKGEVHQRKVREEDIDVIYFKQMWGSTSLGFGGIGGSAMTQAYTTVILLQDRAYIYFGGDFCYSCKIDEQFLEFLKTRSMPGVHEQKRYPLLKDRIGRAS